VRNNQTNRNLSEALKTLAQMQLLHLLVFFCGKGGEGNKNREKRRREVYGR